MLNVTPQLQMTHDRDLPIAYFVYGRVVAPAAGTELCITALLAVGTYKVYAMLCPADTAAPGAIIELQLRFGGDTVTLDQYAVTAAPTPMMVVTRAHPMPANSQVRAVSGTAGAAGSIYYVRIELERVS